MALHHLLYRCPRCGHDPMDGERDSARCPGCARTYTRIREGRRIQIRDTRGVVESALVQSLVGDIERFGGCLTSARAADGRIQYSAEVHVSRCVREEALRYRGSLLGYVERFGEPELGSLLATSSGLRFRPTGGGEETFWDFLELLAIQTSSSALQISPGGANVVQFTFPNDSPYRWEDLVRSLVRAAYRHEGRGDIAEFQPRIVTA